MNDIKLHDTVALTENTKTTQFMTDKEIILPMRWNLLIKMGKLTH